MNAWDAKMLYYQGSLGDILKVAYQHIRALFASYPDLIRPSLIHINIFFVFRLSPDNFHLTLLAPSALLSFIWIPVIALSNEGGAYPSLLRNRFALVKVMIHHCFILSRKASIFYAYFGDSLAFDYIYGFDDPFPDSIAW